MSLDVSLYQTRETEHTCTSCGHVDQTTEPTAYEFFSGNITHNLGRMAEEAGIYEALWRPEEINAKYAKDIIPLLKKGLSLLKKKRRHFEKFNSPNGWGMYEHFVPFVEKYLDACIEEPYATIYVSR